MERPEVHTYVPRSFGTHDNTFHADEVTACALLLCFKRIDRDKIIRTRSRDALSTCEYVCDVGGKYDIAKKRFDHHQVDYQGPLSSAGMVLDYLRREGVMNTKEFEFLNNSLIRGIDAHDNGRDPPMPGVCTFSQVISNFSPPSHDAPASSLDAAFFEALDFAVGHLQRLWNRYQYGQSCREVVSEAMSAFRDCLIFDAPIPWMDAFFELEGDRHPASFVVMPSGNHWKLRGIPPSSEDKMRVRRPLPREWAGLAEDDLKRASGIPGAIFCHKGRFISVWKTKEDALLAFEKVQKATIYKSVVRHEECVSKNN